MKERGIGHFFRPIRDFLFGTVNKEFMIFLFFLLLSGAFWLILTLNESYEREVRIPVKLVGVPKNVVMTSDVDDTLRAIVRDKGYALAAYTYGDVIRPVLIDFKTYARQDGKGSVPGAEIRKQLDKLLYASSTVVQLKPDRYDFFFNYGLNKRVPIKLIGRVAPGDSYYIAKTRFQPDSVTIYAGEALLDSISFVYTDNVQILDVTDTLRQRVSLRKTRGVKCVPDEVYITLYPDVLTEESIEVPITPINVPADRVMRTFPSRVKVVFVTGASLFRTIKPESFSVIVDYNEVVNHPSDKCNVYLRGMPHGVNKANMDLTQVDYLIEQQ